MNYINGQEAKVGDAIVSLSNHRAGVVSRTDGEKLQFLTFVERKAGEAYSLIPVTVGPRGEERHWEPVGLEVPSESCLPISELDTLEATFKQLKRELAEANGARAELQQRLTGLSSGLSLTLPPGSPPAEDPNQNELSLPAEDPAPTPTGNGSSNAS